MTDPVLAAIRSRRVVRALTQEPVARATLESILDAGRWAPTAGNRHLQQCVATDDPRTLRVLRMVSPGMIQRPTAAVVICTDRPAAADYGFPPDASGLFVDVGTAQGNLAVQIARAQPHLTGLGFDLPEVGPIFEDYARQCGVASRVRFASGNFFADPLPKADVVLLGHILHDWNLEEKRMLLRKAHDALPSGGAVIVYDAVIDDDRRQNAFGLLMSLTMLIETTGGFDFTGADCCAWMREVGFCDTYVEHLDGPDSMAVGLK